MSFFLKHNFAQYIWYITGLLCDIKKYFFLESNALALFLNMLHIFKFQDGKIPILELLP